MRYSGSIFAMIALAAVLCAPVLFEAQVSLTGPVVYAAVVSTDVPKRTYGNEIIGASVYGERNETIGNIQTVLFDGGDGDYSVVLWLGDRRGGAGSLVEVPGRLLKVADGRVVIAGATREQLMQLPKYLYASGS